MESLNIKIQKSVDLRLYNSWKVGGKAELFCLPESIEELKEALAWAQSQQKPVTILAGGTNVLISEAGIQGLVIVLQKLNAVKTQIVDERLQIEAEAGISKKEIQKIFEKHSLAPAAFLTGLPGALAGGIVMNAGVGPDHNPNRFSQIVDWIDVLRNGKIIRLDESQLDWDYRKCEGWKPGIIVRVGMSWENDPDEGIKDQVQSTRDVRKAKQPLEKPSCGSVFKNPEGHKSGKLIAQCGLKGFTIGAAQVSQKHSNFIVNLGGATADDLHKVIEHVKATVKAQTGVTLETEVVYLGKF